MTSTTADPGAIDLVAVKTRQNDISASSYQLRDDKIALIAAVEALRERVTELRGDMYVKRVHDAEVRAEAAEAREAELAGALSELLRWHRNQEPDTDEPPGKFIGNARAVLAATPAEALERARAKDKIADVLRKLLGRLDSHFGGPLRNMDWKEQEDARSILAQLDVLGKREG